MGVIMGVKIDEARGNDRPVGIDDLFGNPISSTADAGDSPIFDPHVTLESRHPRAIHDGAILNVKVVLGTDVSPRVSSHRSPPVDEGVSAVERSLI